MVLEAKRVINGTYGEVWLDSDQFSEAYGCQLKIDIKKETIKRCGTGAEDTKMTGWAGKGSIKFHKVNNRMAIKIGNAIKEGHDIRFTIISKLADPDAFGNERVVATGVSFDDLMLADWEAEKNGEVDAPFTFTDYYFLDQITPQ